MIGTGALDFIPIWLLYVATAVIALATAEAGYRLAVRWKRSHGFEKPETGGAMAAAALALLAFYLAFMVSFTINRFDDRRDLVMDEANAIGTTWLRAGYLAEPAGSDIRATLRAYVAERLRIPDGARRPAAITRSNELMTALWAQTEAVVRAGPDTPSTALFVASANETIDLGAKRNVAIATFRVPWTMWAVTYFIAFAAMGLLGYSGGLAESRHARALVVLVLVFSAVINLVVDLDRPYEGLLTVSQEALVELQAQVGVP